MRNTDILPFWEDTIVSVWELGEEKTLCPWLHPSEVQFPLCWAEQGGGAGGGGSWWWFKWHTFLLFLPHFKKAFLSVSLSVVCLYDYFKNLKIIWVFKNNFHQFCWRVGPWSPSHWQVVYSLLVNEHIWTRWLNWKSSSNQTPLKTRDPLESQGSIALILKGRCQDTTSKMFMR